MFRFTLYVFILFVIKYLRIPPITTFDIICLNFLYFTKCNYLTIIMLMVNKLITYPLAEEHVVLILLKQRPLF